MKQWCLSTDREKIGDLPDIGNIIESSELESFALQIAKGMVSFLSLHFNNFDEYVSIFPKRGCAIIRKREIAI